MMLEEFGMLDFLVLERVVRLERRMWMFILKFRINGLMGMEVNYVLF